MKTEQPQQTPFDFGDIDDVRILIRVRSKHYAILPKTDISKEDAKDIRKSILPYVLTHHAVVDVALEDINHTELLKQENL